MKTNKLVFLAMLIILSLVSLVVADRVNKKKMDCKNLKTGEFETVYVPNELGTLDTIGDYVILKTHWED